MTFILTLDLNIKLNFWLHTFVVPIIEFLSFVLIYTIKYHTNLVLSTIKCELFHTTLISNKLCLLNCEQTIMKNITYYYESQRYSKHHD